MDDFDDFRNFTKSLIFVTFHLTREGQKSGEVFRSRERSIWSMNFQCLLKTASAGTSAKRNANTKSSRNRWLEHTFRWIPFSENCFNMCAINLEGKFIWFERNATRAHISEKYFLRIHQETGG